MMDIGKALKLLAECLDEIDCLKALSYKSEDGRLWMNKVEVILKAAFGKDSDEYKELESPYIKVLSFDEEDRQEDYVSDLNLYGEAIKRILQKYEILGVPVAPRTTAKESLMLTPQPKAFIAHGGDSPALRKLKTFLDALGVQPLVVEEQASLDKTLDDKVNHYLGQADCVVILGTGDDEIEGKLHPRQNVIHEIGLAQNTHPGKIIYLLEEGAEFPSNIRPKVWEPFKQDNMENAFVYIVKELRALGALKAVKP